MTTPNPSADSGAPKDNLIDEIIRMSDFSFERLPMLEIIGERLADGISLALPDLIGVLCEASLKQLDYVPMTQAMDALSQPSIMAVCGSQMLNGETLLAMDATLVLTALELMLGGDAKEEVNYRNKEFTSIERGFGLRLGQLIATEVCNSMAVVGDVDMEVDRVETSPDLAAVTQPANLCARMRVTVVLAGHAGLLEVILPYDALQPVRNKLSKVHFGEPSEDGNPWREQILEQIERSNVELETVFAEVSLPIQDIMKWQTNTTINLWVPETHESSVMCNGTEMFKATTGKRNNGNTAIRITETVTEEQEAPHGRSNH